MPDLSDLIANPGKPPREPGRSSRGLYAAAAVGGVVLLGAGFAIGHVTATGGPATLEAAVQEAQTGKLPCGTPPTSTSATQVNGTGGRGAGATFIVARLCQNGATRTGFGGGGTSGAGGGTGGGGFAGRGGGLGALFGPGAVNGTITSVNGGALTLQTRAGDVTVTLPAAAKVTKTTAGSLQDLSNGLSVVVSTTQDSSGNRTATSIFVLPAPTVGQAG